MLATQLSRPSSRIMASTVDQQQRFPAVPPSLSAGDHEMRDYYAPQDASRPTLNQTPYQTPYLGLRARLSQIWINRWTILLLLVLVRLLIAIASVNSSLGTARREALSACTQVENVGSSMASMPHFMSQGINELTATGVEKAVNGLMSMLELSVTGVEEIVIFVIHMMTSTYLCLITLAVSGSMRAAVEIGNAISQNLNKTVDDVTKHIGDSSKSIQDDLNKFLDSLKSLPFGGLKPPTIDFADDINKLNTLKAPASLQKGITDLNNSIPTFDEVQNFTDNIIRLPFEEVRKLMKDNFGNFTFDRAILPVPDKKKLTFCSDGNGLNSFFDKLVELAITAKRVGLAVLIIMAILAIGPMAYLEIRRHRKIERRVALMGKGHDAMDVVYLTSRPTTSTIGLWLGERFGTVRRQTAVRWAFAYATTPVALFLLSLGIAGLFSCACQYFLLKAIEKKTPELTNQVGDFADNVMKSLNNASTSWAGGVNHAVDATNNKINNDILGWVNTTTSTVDKALGGFVDKMHDTIDKAFGNTILKDPIQDVFNCLIGLKVAGIQKGLQWVQDHAHVSFPTMANDTFSLGTLAKLSDSQKAAELLSDPGSTSKDEISEALARLIGKFESGIRTEALIATTLIVIWLLIALAGVVQACIIISRKQKTQPEIIAYNPPLTDNIPRNSVYPETTAPPQYEYPVNKAAPYTIQPRPHPSFGPLDTAEPQSEKVGQVDAHAVAESSRPGHLRASSYAHVADPSPLDEKSNPFSDPHHPRDEKRDPFAG